MRRMGVYLMAMAVFCVFSSPGSFVSAGVAPGPQCKFRKMRAAGRAVLGLALAFGQNKRVPDIAGFNADISSAQSRLTRQFTRAEFTFSGALRGCDTLGDVGVVEIEVENSVDTFMGILCPMPTTTTSTTTTTLP